jgi:hypothetical protein
MIKTKEMIVDYRKGPSTSPFSSVVEQVEIFKFLGVHQQTIMVQHTKTVVKRARQHLFLLRRLKIFGMGPQKVLQLHHREHPDRLYHRLV